MATLTKGRTFVSGETVTPAKLNELVDQATLSSIVDADVSASAAIALSKLGTGALPSGITVASANLVDGTIVNADVNTSAAIAYSKLNLSNSIVAGDITSSAITAAKLDGAQTGSAPIYGCRAWVNFNGARNATDTGASTNGANVLIRASGNVSSVWKNGTGDYTITFTSALPNSNYCLVGTSTQAGSSGSSSVNVVAVMASSANTYATRTTSSVRVVTSDNNNDSAFEAFEVSLAIFG